MFEPHFIMSHPHSESPRKKKPVAPSRAERNHVRVGRDAAVSPQAYAARREARVPSTYHTRYSAAAAARVHTSSIIHNAHTSDRHGNDLAARRWRRRRRPTSWPGRYTAFTAPNTVSRHSTVSYASALDRAGAARILARCQCIIIIIILLLFFSRFGFVNVIIILHRKRFIFVFHFRKREKLSTPPRGETQHKIYYNYVLYYY